MGLFSKKEKVKKEKPRYVSIHLRGLPNVKDGAVCTFDFEDNYLKIEEIDGLLKTKTVRTFKIDNSKIISMDTVSKSNIVTKSKSVVGRGFAGGLIFGPVGAIIGGMSGLGGTSKSEEKFFLNIAYYGLDETDIKTLVFDTGLTDKMSRKFIDEFNQEFRDSIVQVNDKGEIFL